MIYEKKDSQSSFKDADSKEESSSAASKKELDKFGNADMEEPHI